MGEIVVLDLTDVTIDGVPAGSVTDVLLNHDPRDAGGFRSALLAALQAWHERGLAGHAEHCSDLCKSHEAEVAGLKAAAARDVADREAALAEQASFYAAKFADLEVAANARAADLEASHAAALADLQTRHAAELLGWRQANEQLHARLKESEDLVQALGGTELGKKMAKEAKRAEAEKALAEAAARLAELDSEGA